MEPGGTYRWPAMRQVIAQDTSSNGDPVSGVTGNRFTKAIYQPSYNVHNRIYVTWGWACGGSFANMSQDCRGYSQDSHEVFFAYSDDGGENWKNLAGTRTVEAPLCPASGNYCGWDPTKGIVHYDPDFKITTTRQGEGRHLWEDHDGTIYLAFTKSITHESRPGALTLLKFQIGGSVSEIEVNTELHSSVAGIRKDGSTIYIWAEGAAGQIAYEYTSGDEGSSWQRQDLFSTYCPRLSGNTNMRARDMAVFACVHVTDSRNERSDVYYYYRTFLDSLAKPSSVTGLRIAVD